MKYFDLAREALNVADALIFFSEGEELEEDIDIFFLINIVEEKRVSMWSELDFLTVFATQAGFTGRKIDDKFELFLKQYIQKVSEVSLVISNQQKDILSLLIQFCVAVSRAELYARVNANDDFLLFAAA